MFRLVRRERHDSKNECTADKRQHKNFPFILSDHGFNLNSEKKVPHNGGVLKITYLNNNFKINYSGCTGLIFVVVYFISYCLC